MSTNLKNTATIPLCVDLDGTLIKTDLLWESLVQLINRNPLYAFVLPFWLLRGRTCLKMQIARRVQLDAALLPYRAEFLKFLREEKTRGRQLILATASHRLLADHYGDYIRQYFIFAGESEHWKLYVLKPTTLR